MIYIDLVTGGEVALDAVDLSSQYDIDQLQAEYVYLQEQLKKMDIEQGLF